MERAEEIHNRLFAIAARRQELGALITAREDDDDTTLIEEDAALGEEWSALIEELDAG
jgi:hypothetical protein